MTLEEFADFQCPQCGATHPITVNNRTVGTVVNAANGLIVALWGVDRIWGLPIGPEHWKPEPVGFGDSVTAAFELLLVAGCVALLARDRERPLRGSVAAVLTLTVVALTALSLLSVLGVGASLLTPTE